MWELSGCVKPPDVHKKYPPCPSPPLIEGGPGASFTWRSSPRAKERCPPAVILGVAGVSKLSRFARHAPLVTAAMVFAVLHMRGKEGGDRGATLEAIPVSQREMLGCIS